MQSLFERATAVAKDLQTSAQNLDLSSQFRQVTGAGKSGDGAEGAATEAGEKPRENVPVSSGADAEVSDGDHGAASSSQAPASVTAFFSRAKEMAKDMAHNAKATAEEAQGSFMGLTANIKSLNLKEGTTNLLKSGGELLGASGGGEEAAGGAGEGESLERHGVSASLAAYVKGLRPKDFLAKSKEWPKEDKDSWRLTPWQEKHVLLILEQVPELRDCRYFLTPKKMSEQRFWEIYFALSQNHMFAGDDGDGDGDGAASSGAGASDDAATATTPSASTPSALSEENVKTISIGGGDLSDDDEDGGDDLSDDLEACVVCPIYSQPLSSNE